MCNNLCIFLFCLIHSTVADSPLDHLLHLVPIQEGTRLVVIHPGAELRLPDRLQHLGADTVHTLVIHPLPLLVCPVSLPVVKLAEHLLLRWVLARLASRSQCQSLHVHPLPGLLGQDELGQAFLDVPDLSVLLGKPLCQLAFLHLNAGVAFQYSLARSFSWSVSKPS